MFLQILKLLFRGYMNDLIPMHDVHVHTKLSLCSGDITANFENMLSRADELGIELLGFTDHMWGCEGLPKSNMFYKKQTFDRQCEQLLKLPSQVGNVKIIKGVETEYANGILGITEEQAEKLDYVIAPHSHLHMYGFARPLHIINAKQIGKYMVKTFIEVANNPLVDAIAHPFDPCIKYDKLAHMYSAISDKDFEECFMIAKANNVSIEINISSFNDQIADGERSQYYFRMFEIARQVGCKFHFGSDTHSVDRLDRCNRSNIDIIANIIGIRRFDIADFILDNCK